MKILIVEDDPIWRHKIRSYLASLQHDVIEVEDGGAAWRQMQTEAIRLVITDWTMPVMDGTELIRRIRAGETDSYTYVIVVTGRESKEDVVAGLQAGADDYLVKPVDANELRARVAIGERIINLESNLSESMAKLEELATHDALTGLLNRRALYERLRNEITRVERGLSPVSIVFIDLDHFKSVNDTYGHLAGDQALKGVADILQSGMRAYDWAARWGGEEFLLVLPGADIAKAAAFAERIREKIAATPIDIGGGQSVQLTVSIGVASSANGDVQQVEDLLQRSDAALYRAKEGGRNQVQLAEFSAAETPRAQSDLATR